MTFQEYTIWFDRYHVWYFLIPSDQTMPSGDVVIKTITGRVESVDPDFLEEYVVPREYAEAYLSGVVRDGLDDIKQGVMSFLSQARQKPQYKGDTAWNTNFLADIFGHSEEAVRTDPDVTKDILTNLFAEATTFLQNVKSDDEDQQTMARQQMSGFLDLLKAYDIKVSDEAYSIPDVLIQSYQAQDTDNDKQ